MRERLEALFRFARQSAVHSQLGSPRLQGLPKPLQALAAAMAVCTIAVLSAISLAAFGLLFTCFLVMFLLLRDVLGVSFPTDPEALLQELQRQAAVVSGQR
jgi:hypothetical protein